MLNKKLEPGSEAIRTEWAPASIQRPAEAQQRKHDDDGEDDKDVHFVTFCAGGAAGVVFVGVAFVGAPAAAGVAPAGV